MGDNKEKIDKLFSGGFSNFEAETPHDGWQAVKAKIIKSKQKRKALLLRWSMVTIALLLAFFAGYKIQNFRSGKPAITVPIENQISNSFKNQNENPSEKNEAPKQQDQNENDPQQKLKNPKNKDGKNSSSDFDPDALDDRKIATGDQNENSSTVNFENEGLKNGINPSPNNPSEGNNPTAQASGDTEESVGSVGSVGSVEEQKIEIQNLVLLPELGISDYEKPLFLDYNSEFELNSYTYSDPSTPYHKLPIYPSKLRRLFYDLEIGIYAGPSIPSRTVTFGDPEEVDQSTKNNYANEQLLNTTSYGLQISKRWRNIEYGIGFFASQWRQTSNNIILQSEPINNSTSVYTDRIRGTTSIGDFTLNISDGAPIQPSLETGQYLFLPNILQEYQFLDIPVTSSYYILDRRFKLKLQLGLNNRILTNSMVQLEFPNGEKQDFDDLQPEPYSLQLITGLGFSYNLTRRWSLNLVPSYFYGLSPISIQEGAQTKQHQISILSGISFRL